MNSKWTPVQPLFIKNKISMEVKSGDYEILIIILQGMSSMSTSKADVTSTVRLLNFIEDLKWNEI